MIETPTVTINGKEYAEDQLTDQQRVILNHITDLDRKLDSVRFTADQLAVGREAFVQMLVRSFETVPTD